MEFVPRNAAGENLEAGPAQNMFLPFDYTFGTDKVRLTIVAREYDFTNNGFTHWNNFAFGFTDTLGNLSNMVLLFENPEDNPSQDRTRVQLWNNGVTYRRNINPGANAEFFRELALEYDPTKVNTPGVNPYTLYVDGVPMANAINTIPESELNNTNYVDVGIPEMTTDGGATFDRMRGIGWGFWNGQANAEKVRSVLIKSIKFETIAQSVVTQDGDFNLDGVVDGADYVAWQKNNSLGTYQEWVENFGESLPGSGGGGGGVASVPEPASAAMLLVASILFGMVRTPRIR
jgi:hypothetical protein